MVPAQSTHANAHEVRSAELVTSFMLIHWLQQQIVSNSSSESWKLCFLFCATLMWVCWIKETYNSESNAGREKAVLKKPLEVYVLLWGSIKFHATQLTLFRTPLRPLVFLDHWWHSPNQNMYMNAHNLVLAINYREKLIEDFVFLLYFASFFIEGKN